MLLNAYTDADVAAHLAGEDEETAQRFGWWPLQSTEATVRAAHERWAVDWRGHGKTRAFAVREAASERLVGGCELRLHDDGSGQLSWWTHATERRKGYATRAVKLLVEYAETLGLDRLEAHIGEDNHASRKVAVNAGFDYLDTFAEEGAPVRRYELRTHRDRRAESTYHAVDARTDFRA